MLGHLCYWYVEFLQTIDWTPSVQKLKEWEDRLDEGEEIPDQVRLEFQDYFEEQTSTRLNPAATGTRFK